jgi:transcriptional regulator with XRE-family HTH domain
MKTIQKTGNLKLKEFGEFIKSKRAKKGWTQQQLAIIANEIGCLKIDKSYISKVEKNLLSGMEIGTILSLLKSLDCSLTFKEN